MSWIIDKIFGEDGGLKKKQFTDDVFRSQFSQYLPYVAYDEESGVYVNQDDSFGTIWECYPLAFASEKIIDTLEGIFRLPLPDNSVLQFTLYADRHLEPFLDAYDKQRTRRDNPLVTTCIGEYQNFVRNATDGLASMSNIPIRNYRVFVSLKVPGAAAKEINWTDMQKTVFEALKGAKLYPRHLPPEQMLDFMRRLFNEKPGDNPSHYDDNTAIRKQIIRAETEMIDKSRSMQIGGRHFRCTTPKAFPKDIYLLQTHELFGGVWGVECDEDQVKTPYLYTLNVVFQDLKSALHAKCNLVLQQQGVGSFAPSLSRKKEEYLRAVDDLERNQKFVKILPIMWVWSDDERECIDSITRVKRVWETNGYVMQEDRGILKIMLLAALPFGLYPQGSNLDNLDRDFIAPSNSVTPVIPIQADFPGGGKPIMTFYGRKGQISGIDLFHKSANNHNLFVAASSGSGKSFLVNMISFSYFSSGALIRIVDIGGSYKKMTNMLGARYLDFGPGNEVCLNPFSHIREPQHELNAVAAVVAQMAYSSAAASVSPSETEMNIIRESVRWAWEQKQQQADIDDCYVFLKEFPHAPGCNLEDVAQNMEIVGAARKMAFNLREFTSEGTYGAYFNGPSTFDISNDEFCVLELEHLKPMQDLYRVVTLMVINAVTQDLYLSDRSKPRLIIFDEAWQFLGEGALLQQVVEEGYRRARKYGGSFSIITQSILDLELFGSVGDVIRANSAFKFFLESPDFRRARSQDLIDYDEFTMRLLESLRSNRPFYSEIFADTPFGKGIVRLAVDPYSYYIYTSAADEIAEIEAMCDEGMSYHEAITEMVKKYRG